MKDRHIQDIEIAVFDRAHAVESQIHLLGGKLPRRRARFAYTGGKKPVVDMIALPAKFLETATLYANMPLLKEKIAVFNLTGFLSEVQLQGIGRFDFPLRVVDRDTAFGLDFLSRAIETDLVRFERGCLALDFHVANGFDLVGAVSRR